MCWPRSLRIFIFTFFVFFVLSCFSIHAREVMACYIRKFPGEIRNQGWVDCNHT